MELYEAMIIISPELEDDDHQEVLNGLSSTVTSNSGTVSTILDWRKRRLAYEIDKFTEGHYYLIYFSCEGTVIPEIEHYFRVSDEIIRFMVVRTDEKEFEAAAKKAASEAETAKKAAAEESAVADESAAEAETGETEGTESAETETPEPVQDKQEKAVETEVESSAAEDEEEKPADE
ncbi:MAG: 30S ribosomal protein S6 [Bacillota bacterium]